MNFSVRKYWAALLPLLFGAILATAAPAGRGAVLQYMNGTVSIQPHGTGSWVAAAVNDPLKNADNVWSDKASRAELNAGTGVLQMNAETSLTLVNVAGPTIQLRLNQGTLYLHVRHLFDGEIYEVDSRDGAFTITKSGDYRFDVDPKADVTTITVWKGEGSVTSGERAAVRVKAHEQIRLAGVAAAYERHKAPKPDGFDEWCRLRDQRLDSAYPRGYPYPYPYPYPPGVVIYGRPGPWYWR
jgi:hypothetical protein